MGPRKALALACLLGASAGWAMTAAGAGAATLAPGYDAGLVTIGLMTTALAAPYALLQLPAGTFVDRVGPRAASLLGLGVVVLVHLLAISTPLTWLALACRSVAGVGYAVCFVSGAELVRRSGAGPSAMGIFGGVALAASGVAVVVVPLAEPLLGWRAAWVTSGLVALLAVVLLTLTPSAGQRSQGRAAMTPRPDADPATRQLLRDGELHRLGAIHAVTLGLGVVLSNWVTVVLVDTWGFDRPAAAATAFLVLGLSVLSRPLGGAVAHRSPSRPGFIAAGSLIGCAVATAALTRPTVPAVAIAAVLAIGMLSGLPFAALLSAAQARRPDRPAAAVGLLNSQANALILVGAPALGAGIAASHASLSLLGLSLVWVLPLAFWPRSYRSEATTSSALNATCSSASSATAVRE